MTNNQEPLERFIEQLNQILDTVEHPLKEEDLPPGVKKKIRELAERAEKLKALNEILVKNFEITEEKLKSVEGMSSRGKRVFERIQELKTVFAKKSHIAALKAARAKEHKKNRGKERVKKFRKMGGQKNWKPL